MSSGAGLSTSFLPLFNAQHIFVFLPLLLKDVCWQWSDGANISSRSVSIQRKFQLFCFASAQQL